MEYSVQQVILKKDTPQLVALLAEMKDGLDIVRSKLQLLTEKAKEDDFLTADGFSYLEAYCQSIVYYLLRKAKGFSIQAHPLVRSLVEIRLFLEKVRPVDKKQDYQIEKLLKIASNTAMRAENGERNPKAGENTNDLLKYRPNPDLLVPKLTNTPDGEMGVYKPPFLAPIEMVDDDKISKLEKQKIRMEKQNLRRMNKSSYMSELINDHQGRPEEVRERRRLGDSEILEATKLLAELEQVKLSESDDTIWWGEIDRRFTVRSCSNYIKSCKASLLPIVAVTTPWNKVWMQHTPSKVNFFLWLAVKNKLITMEFLQRKGYSLANCCSMCNAAEENTCHLFLQCTLAKSIWEYFWVGSGSRWPDFGSLTELLKGWKRARLSSQGRVYWKVLCHSILWHIWLERNNRTFEDQRKDLQKIVEDIKDSVWKWCLDLKETKGISLSNLMLNWDSVINRI